VLQDVIKKVVRRVRRTTVLPQVRSTWRMSERRACAVLDGNRKMLHYRSVKCDDPVLRGRIKEIAWSRIRYGYRRITVLLRREGWMDFMHDVLADGTKVRFLTIVDNFSRESLALEVGYGFKSTQAVEVLRVLVEQRGKPHRIHCDNGPEFVSLQLDQWAY